MKLRYAAATDVGLKRSHNEDCFAVLETEQLFIVCDGMGGHASGEVASKLATDSLIEFYRRTGADREATWPYRMDKRISEGENRLVCGVRLANLRVYEDAYNHLERRGMGTTVVAVVANQDKLLLAHVGDSRCYRARAGALAQLTRDHSLLEEMKAVAPDMTEEQQAAFPHKNVITRALGMRESVDVDLRVEPVEVGDRFVLCSDGLSGMVSDATLLQKVSAATELEPLVTELIAAANAAGGVDNITVLVLERSA
jgi:protein phosphatase